MRLATATLITLAAAALSTAAVASMARPVVAKLETPVPAARTDVVAAGVAWRCEGDTCASRIERRTPVVRDCGQLAREVGRLTAFTVGDVSLDAEGLAACNARAR